MTLLVALIFTVPFALVGAWWTWGSEPRAERERVERHNWRLVETPYDQEEEHRDR